MKKIAAILFFSISMSLYSNPADEPEYPEKLLKELYTLLDKNEFVKAEELAKQNLTSLNEFIEIHVVLDQALNGQKKFKEAAGARENILSVWNKYYRRDFLRRGSPVRERTWARFVTKTDKHLILSCDFYIPEIIGKAPYVITNYYKFIVFTRNQGNNARVFKLEYSNLIDEYYVLSELIGETGHNQYIIYGKTKPDIYKITEDLAAKLAEEK